jgi:hypothetical protein
MMSKYGPAYTELGQILLTNTETLSHEAQWAVGGLHTLAKVIAEYRGLIKDNHEYVPLLTSNDGEQEFDNDTFTLRSYCWCDGSFKGHEDSCPPNFVYKPTDVNITWYKHVDRGITANVEYLGPLTWHRLINDCIESIFK